MRNDFAESLLSLNQRQISHVTAVQPENIESVVNGWAFPFHQTVKGRLAGAVQRYDFTVQYSVFNFQLLGYQESRQSTDFGSLKYVQRLPIVSRQRLVRIQVETVSILILRQSVNFRYA